MAWFNGLISGNRLLAHNNHKERIERKDRFILNLFNLCDPCDLCGYFISRLPDFELTKNTPHGSTSRGVFIMKGQMRYLRLR